MSFLCNWLEKLFFWNTLLEIVHVFIDEGTEHVPYKAVGCCKYPVLMNKSTTAGMGECGFWLTGRPDLKQAEKKLTKQDDDDDDD